MAKLAIVIALLALAYSNDARQFSRCELVRELRRQGFPTAQLRDWVCLIEAESNRITNSVSRVNTDGSRNYGLFQISDRYWCNNGPTPGKDCNVRCRDLLTSNISRASACARRIFNRHGFRAWYGWRNRCQGSLPNISSC